MKEGKNGERWDMYRHGRERPESGRMDQSKGTEYRSWEASTDVSK
jgi:hypothetical protein